MDRMEPKRNQSRLEGAHLPQAPAHERFDVYEVITNRIIDRIEKGVVPWQSPSIARVGFPRDFSTGKSYTVFNSCQIDGIKFPEVPKCEPFTESVCAENARRIVEEMPSRPIIHEGRKSFPHYLPEMHTVEMPRRETFRAEWRFYRTLFHELAHATRHERRLNRESLTENRGRYAVGETNKIYCLEELVAEMTAAFLGARAGIIEDGFENSAAYLRG